MTENPRHPLKGPQDPRLEVGRRPSKSTPTKGSDIGPGARVYMRLVETAVTHTMALEGLRGDTSNPFFHVQQEALATVRDEVRAFGFNQEGFDLVTKDRIDRLKAKTKAEEDDAKALAEVRAELTRHREAIKGDMDLVRAEFPNQFDRLAELGDVPPNINFGNHAFKKDPFGL